MSTVKATWKNGHVVLDQPAEWPEGRRLVVAEEAPVAIDFATEDDQRDDPESVQQWIDDLRAIPPLPITAQQEAAMVAWQQKTREFNLDAVRKQMEEGRL